MPVAHGGRTLATVEAGPLPYELTDELETVGPCDFAGTLPGGFAAHTKLDHETGELHAIAYFWAWDYVQHVVVDATGKVTRTTTSRSEHQARVGVLPRDGSAAVRPDPSEPLHKKCTNLTKS